MFDYVIHIIKLKSLTFNNAISNVRFFTLLHGRKVLLGVLSFSPHLHSSQRCIVGTTAETETSLPFL